MADGTQAAKATANDPSDLEARLDDVLARQRAYFGSGATLPRAFREDQLHNLLVVIERKEKVLLEALAHDLGRPRVEGYAAEVGGLTSDIRHTLKHLRSWMKPRRKLPPLVAVPSISAVHMQPLGLNLIIAPWNYPIQLALGPLIPAIAAGNVAIIKPSELAPASSSVVTEVVREAFSEEYVAVFEGGVDVSQALLRRPFDHLFFTGGTRVGRIVAHAGAEHLSRVTLELGGKSPTIVTETADLDVAAKRIAMGKFFNAGQTCIAPDYLMVHESVHDPLLERIASCVREFYGDDPSKSNDFGRIINDHHFERLVRLIDEPNVRVGGQAERQTRYIAPTVQTEATLDSAAMADEIFGPILPVMKIRSLQDAVDVIRERPNPLALYLFTTDSHDEKAIVDRVSFGGGCINNTLYHYADPQLPFGGIGTSGIGAYHGKYGFETFSHQKGVLKTGNFLDPSMKYPPYTEGKFNLIRKVFG